MKRVVWAALAASAALLAGCNSPHLALAQDNAVSVPVGASFAFAGVIQDASGTILWKLDGPGSLSTGAGLTTVYTAPAAYDPSANKATLVASLSEAPDEKQTVGITITKPTSSVGGIPGLASAVSVTYDERDIPTINCTKSVDCYAVLGFIHARDRLFQMDVYRRVGRGTLSELVGEGGLERDEAFRTLFTTRDGKSLPEELAAYVMTDPLVGPIATAYLAGVNAYIAQVRGDPSKLPAAYKQLQYVINPADPAALPDWTLADSAAVERLQLWLLSDDTAKEADLGLWAKKFASDPVSVGAWILAKGPVASYTLTGTGAPNAPSLPSASAPMESLRSTQALQSASRALASLRSLRPSLGAPPASNNWVVDKDHTDIGQAIVANDPHLDFSYPSIFHLVHLIGTEDQLNWLGPLVPGLFANVIGRGSHVGYGATVVGYDVTDLYSETLVFQGQTPVGISFNGNTVPFTVVQPVYKFRTVTGLATLSNPNPILVSPPHGPIIAFDPANGLAISTRWTGNETQTDEFRAILRLVSAASVDDARQALEGDPKPDGGRYTGFWTGAQNFVLADDQGNIGYVPHACVPSRPWAQNHLIYPYPVVPMDGRGSFEWAKAPDGGLLCLSDDKLPIAIGSDKGYLATANADPLGTTDDNNPYENNPGGIPYLSFDWTDMGFRVGRIQEVLDQKTRDGAKVSLADLQALQSDHVVTVARPFIQVIEALDLASSSDTNVAAAVTMLLAWNSADAGTPLDCPTGLAPGSLDPVSAINDSSPTNSANSAACLLFHTFLRRVLTSTFLDEETAAGVSRSELNEIRAFLALVSGAIPNPNNSLCSDVDAQGHKSKDRTCASQLSDALGWAYRSLTQNYATTSNWRWGRVHTVTFPFIVSGYPLIDPQFQPGPFPRPGGALTVDVGSPVNPDPNNLNFAYGSGGGVRWLAAMDGKVEHTFEQLPGVESGGPYPFGRETMMTDWVLNKYFNWPFQASDVTSVRSETFSP